MNRHERRRRAALRRRGYRSPAEIAASLVALREHLTALRAREERRAQAVATMTALGYGSREIDAVLRVLG